MSSFSGRIQTSPYEGSRISFYPVSSSQFTEIRGSVGGYNSVTARAFFRLHLMQEIMQDIRIFPMKLALELTLCF